MTLEEFNSTGWYKNMPVVVLCEEKFVKAVSHDDYAVKISSFKGDNSPGYWIDCCAIDFAPVQPTALDLIAAEREKQISKGYTVEHDAAYVQRTGISYSLLADRLLYNGDLPDDWNMDYWIKLRNLPIKRKLAIAGAWIAAELDRVIYEENQSV